MKVQVVGLSELRKRLAQLRDRTGNLRPALLKGAIIVIDKAKADIASGGDPPWIPTKYPSNKHPMLIRTGTLFRSFSDADATSDIPNGIRAGTNVEYAPFQQFGTSAGIPGRPFLPDPSEEPMASKIREVIAQFIATGQT